MRDGRGRLKSLEMTESRSYEKSNWLSPKSSSLVILSIIDNPPSSLSPSPPAVLRYSQVISSISAAVRPNVRRIASGYFNEARTKQTFEPAKPNLREGLGRQRLMTSAYRVR